MNGLKKKIIYYYLVITSVLLVCEWYLYRLSYEYIYIWSSKTGINETVFTAVLALSGLLLFCIVSYLYYGKVNNVIIKESERQAKERNIIFANIAHDLKNPMASVLGFARALEEGAVSDEDKSKIYHLIGDKSNQMNDMILKMFQYAKLESCGYNLKLQEMDICAVIRGVVADRYSEMEAHNIEPDVDIPDDKILVKLDTAEFPRAVNNLISNAINHNEAGIKLLISVKLLPNLHHNSKVRIMVADSGAEIAGELQSNIFEPFQCSDSSRAAKDGSGLGLAITKRIVNLHHGKIYIDNNVARYTKAFVVELEC